MKILFVAGTWDEQHGKPSTLAQKLYTHLKAIIQHGDIVEFHNGGKYDRLQGLLEATPNFDVVLWFANVSNDLPKIRDVKTVAPAVMLVNSKRNDDNKYTFQEIVQRTLAAKANLTFEFRKTDDIFNIQVFDPLGCQWYDGTDAGSAMLATVNRLKYLLSITRQRTIQSPDDKSLVLNWYFDRFKQDMHATNKKVDVPDEWAFVNLVREYAEKFHEIMNPGCDVKRFIGNCSMRPETESMPPQVGRCSKGMPSFRHGDWVFVSQRNVDKQFLNLEHFVPVFMHDGEIYYCGENKPSVDTPIQLRLYNALPNIRYMIHSHCYIKDGHMTSMSIPCGAIEEADEVLGLIDRVYGTRNGDIYEINLLGHGSIVMADSINKLRDLEYYGRRMPEPMLDNETET